MSGPSQPPGGTTEASPRLTGESGSRSLPGPRRPRATSVCVCAGRGTLELRQFCGWQTFLQCGLRHKIPYLGLSWPLRVPCRTSVESTGPSQPTWGGSHSPEQEQTLSPEPWAPDSWTDSLRERLTAPAAQLLIAPQSLPRSVTVTPPSRLLRPQALQPASTPHLSHPPFLHQEVLGAPGSKYIGHLTISYSLYW